MVKQLDVAQLEGCLLSKVEAVKTDMKRASHMKCTTDADGYGKQVEMQ